VSGRLWRLDPLTSGGVAWRFAGDDDTQEDFDAQGRLLRVAYRAGALITAHWGEAGAGTVSGSSSGSGQRRLVALSDAYGRRLSFSYDDWGRLVAAVGADGARVAYAYDPAGRLARVVLPDGSTRQYLYEDARFPLALTGLIDERGLRLASWAYDARGRAVHSEHAGVARHQLAYGVDGTVSITDPLGRVRTQQYQRVGQRLRLAGQSGPCVDCAGDIARREIDAASGLAWAEEDFLGVRTETTWEATRRLPLARVQAAGRPEARAVQVEWHPQWRLPLRVMERGRTTDFRYDDAGRLLTRTVMDSTGGVLAWAGATGGARRGLW
jgi:YD repeat-containing protein